MEQVSDNIFLSFATKYNLEEIYVKQYADSMRMGNLGGASYAFQEIRRKVRLDNSNDNLMQFSKRFAPIRENLYKEFGNIDGLRDEAIRATMKERNIMEAARKRIEEEAKIEQHRLQEFQDMSDDHLDEEYLGTVEEGNEPRMRDLVNEAARRKGYEDTDSSYQGEGAWVAPADPGYENAEARRADVEENSPDVNMEDISKGYSPQPDDYFSNLRAYGTNTPEGRESAQAINSAMDAIRSTGNIPMVKVYRAVPPGIKESIIRNADWVTPSKKYAEMHGNHRLEGKYRIMEQEVPANELWWDGNDINEWGFDDGKDYRYKNTKNNRKLNDLVTRDDKGNIIPLSQRFNSRKNDIRFRIGDTKKISRDGRKIIFTRAKPAQTLVALKKYLKSEGIACFEETARTKSSYLEFEKEGVSYNIRFANHTKGIYGSFSDMQDNGLDINYSPNGIKGVSIDMALNDYGIDRIKSLMSDIENFNLLDNSEKDLDKYSSLLLDISENKTLTSLTTLFPELYGIVARDLAIAAATASMEAGRKADKLFGGDMHYIASNGIEITDKGGRFGISTTFPTGWTGKTKIPTEEAIEEYKATEQYTFQQDIYNKKQEYVNGEREKYAAILKKYNSSDIRYRFIGEKGAAALDKAEEGTIRLDNLSVACEMEDAGKEPLSIKMATGWERGADRKWRYETGDSKLKDTISIGGKEFKRYEEDMLWTSGKLVNTVDNEALFIAYPELVDVRLETDTMTGNMPSNGAYNSATRTIHIHASELKYLNQLLNHEIQHAVQDIEGFASGSSSEQFRNTREEIIRDLNFFTNGNILKGNAITDGASVRQALGKLIPYTDISLRTGYADKLERVARKYGYENFDGLLAGFDSMPSAMEQYHKTAGEVESRNVVKRMSFTPDQRKNTLAVSTEDVARDGQIFLSRESRMNQLSHYASSLAEKQHIPVSIVRSVDEVNSPGARDLISSGKDIRGWYDVPSDRICLYLPHAQGKEDIEHTLLHEGVAHYGLRKLAGRKHMDAFLDDVFDGCGEKIRGEIVRLADTGKMQIRTATEEYLANLAENGTDLSVWDKICLVFRNLLRKIGFHIEIGERELKGLLTASRENLKKTATASIPEKIQTAKGELAFAPGYSSASIRRKDSVQDATFLLERMKKAGIEPASLSRDEWESLFGSKGMALSDGRIFMAVKEPAGYGLKISDATVRNIKTLEMEI